MQAQIDTLIQKAKADYVKFATAGGRGMPEEGSYFANELANFEDSFEAKEGKKFIKMLRKNNGVWGFIVKDDFVTNKGKSFKKGDILKAAGFNAPALNQARGNIFEEFSVAWTGPHYLV